MIYKNSIRVLFSNFNLVWKVLLYTLISLLIIGGLSYVSALPVFRLLLDNGFFDMISKIFADFVTDLNLLAFIEGLGDIFNSFFEIIIDNFSSVWGSIVLFLFVTIIFGKFLLGIINLTCAYALYASMSSNMKIGIVSIFFNNFGRILLFEISKFIITFPIDLVIIYVVFLCFKLFAFGGWVSILTPFVIVLVAVLLISLRSSVFSCWMPIVAVQNNSIFQSLKDNFKFVGRRFFKIFGNSVGITLTIIMLNGFALIFTLGVGQILFIPLSTVLSICFQMAAYYSAYGMRYYVDSDTIVQPKRLKETEKLSKIKYYL